MITSSYNFLTEENKFSLNKFQDQNIVYYSELNKWHTKNAFRSISLKYVLSGSIQYTTNHNEFNLIPGKILVASRQSDVQAYFDASDLVKSMCIDISTNTVNEIFSFHTSKSEDYFEDFSTGIFKEFGFVEKVYALDLFTGSNAIKEIVQHIQNSKEQVYFSSEFFYHLAEKIVAEQYQIYSKNISLPFSKVSTRNEIARRLAIAKEYMDDCFLKIKSNSEIAKVCYLSEYHFMRTFSTLYKISPFQYVLDKRLDHARWLMCNDGTELKWIAQEVGYPDFATFSKAFKRKFNYPPSVYREIHFARQVDA